jgi:hypothetical protein
VAGRVDRKRPVTCGRLRHGDGCCSTYHGVDPPQTGHRRGAPPRTNLPGDGNAGESYAARLRHCQQAAAVSSMERTRGDRVRRGPSADRLPPRDGSGQVKGTPMTTIRVAPSPGSGWPGRDPRGRGRDRGSSLGHDVGGRRSMGRRVVPRQRPTSELVIGS